MNIKLYTPKSLKNGSGMAYRKEREKLEKSSSKDEDAREKKIKEVQRLVLQLDAVQKELD